jgi:xylulokinase
MLLLGIDLGTSSVKVSVVDAATQHCVASASYPDTEAAIAVPQAGWAEQDPDLWWEYTGKAILRCHASGTYKPADIGAIGIAYQMHGLVLTDKQQRVLRPSIIWCDSRAVALGDEAFDALGASYCRIHLLNSPGNFTASKLAWVKQNEPAVYAAADKMMLPGDFLAMRFTGQCTSTVSGLSEGMFWDFAKGTISEELLKYWGLNESLIAPVTPLFSEHGRLLPQVAEALQLQAGIPVTYKAGDQPNNALALNVLAPGELAATAGTSGVVYAVTGGLAGDNLSRINSFAHVNHTTADPRIGLLLCINATGIFQKWIKEIVGRELNYPQLNELAAAAPSGSDGLLAIPFGNGAERMLQNRITGAHFHNIDLNKHGRSHMARAVQEGIACAFRYGVDIMKENGVSAQVVRASRANLFLSPLFAQAFADINQVSVEFFEGRHRSGYIYFGDGSGHVAKANRPY